MRTLATLAAVLLFTSAGCAQVPSLVTKAHERLTTHDRNQLSFARSIDFASQHRWYWEDTSPSAEPACPFGRSLTFAAANDFSPFGLSWEFTGKHPLVPSLDVIGFNLKAGAQPLSPDAIYGFIAPPRIWNRASHALASALHY